MLYCIIAPFSITPARVSLAGRREPPSSVGGSSEGIVDTIIKAFALFAIII